MSRATITLPNDLLEELLGAVEAKSKTDAVVKAIKDKIKMSKIERIKQMAGRMEFVKTAEEIRHGDKRLG
jgi:metal-responsive CopG/Arc/MetJ family transcriptional regulator